MDTIPIHKNNTSIQQPGVSKATNSYAIGTNIKKKFNGTFYCRKVASDNGKWNNIQYDEGNEEETTQRQDKLIIEYNPILFTAGFSPALSPILFDTEKKSNITFKGLSMIQDIAFSVTHPVTGRDMEWKELVLDPLIFVGWTHSSRNELGRIAQGVGKIADDIQQSKGTYTIFSILSYKVPKSQKVTYIP